VESQTQTPAKADGAPATGTQRGETAPPPTEPVKAARKGPPIPVLVGIGIVVLVALFFGIKYFAYASTHETTDDAKIDADTVAITSKISERVSAILVDTNQPVRKGQVLVRLDHRDESSKLASAVAARDAQRAQARAAQSSVGLTQSTQAAQNQQASGGISAAQSGIQSADAQYQSALEQIGVSKAVVAQSQAQLRVAQSQVPAARANLARANADYQRTSSLVSTGDIARSQLDAVRASQAAARAQYQSAIDNVTAAQTAVTQASVRVSASASTAAAAQSQIGTQQGQLATAEGKLAESGSPYRISTQQAQADAAFAQVASLEAQVRTAQDQVNNTTIVSPIDGYVGEKNVEVGRVVSPGEPLLAIVPSGKIYVTANYKETQIGKMKVGQEVDLKVDAYKGVTFHGHLDSIGPAAQNTFSLLPAQNATGNFVKVTQRLPVRILFDNPPADKPLRPGMSVEASVRVK
jgi:membrane fusion protein (multidrug efflux system)